MATFTGIADVFLPGLRAYALSANGSGPNVQALTAQADGNRNAIVAQNDNGSGYTALYAENYNDAPASAGRFAIFGRCTGANSSPSVAVSGESASSSGVGVKGTADGANATGVWGGSVGTNGEGVRGVASGVDSRAIVRCS